MLRPKTNRTQEQQSPLTRMKFEARFNSYGPFQRMPSRPRITGEQMDMLFRYAEEYRRDSLGLPARDDDNQPLMDDTKAREQQMVRIRDRLDELDSLITEVTTAENGTTTTGGDRARSYLASLRQVLEEEFEFENRRKEAVRKRLSTQTRKHALLEFTVALQLFVRNAFPKLDEGNQRRVIGAAIAGAGCLTKAQREAGTQRAGLRMTFKRGTEYLKQMASSVAETYLEEGYGDSLEEKKQRASKKERKSR